MPDDAPINPPVPAQSPAVGGDPLMLDPESAVRIAAVVRWVEGQFRLPGPGPSRGGRGGGEPGCIAVAVGAISARAGATYGTGTIKFQVDDGTSLSDDGDRDQMPVKNLFNKTIADTAYIGVSWMLGSWWVSIPDDCANLS